MIPPNGEKRYHLKPSFFSFLGNLYPNKSGELTKKGNSIQNTCGIKNSPEVVSVYSLVKTSNQTNIIITFRSIELDSALIYYYLIQIPFLFLLTTM